MEKDLKRDEFIRKLVSQQAPEKAPEGFSERVMERLQPETVQPHTHILSPLAWAGIFVGATALIIIMFFVDIPFLPDFFSSTGMQKLSLNVFNSSFYDSFVRFFKGMNINAIGIAIVIGFISLVALERIISRKRSAHRLILL